MKQKEVYNDNRKMAQGDGRFCSFIEPYAFTVAFIEMVNLDRSHGSQSLPVCIHKLVTNDVNPQGLGDR